MMRKMFSAVLVFGLVFTALLTVNVYSEVGLDKDDVKDLVYGDVCYSADSLAKIFENDAWVCKNITAYCVDEYENGIVDLAIGNEINNLGESHVSNGYDYFRFNPSDAGWSNYNLNQEHIVVGETTVDGKDYVFITTFIYKIIDGNRRGYCEATEWEPIPTPIVYAEGDTWINISIPKFTNPVIKSWGGSGTPNMNNTTGFAVYRNGTFGGNTTFSSNKHYFFNDTISPGSVYNYSVSPILKGNYTVYGRSAGLSSDEPALAPLSVVLKSLNGGEAWKGGSVQDIKYSIAGGLGPYTVTLKYSTNGGVTYPYTINTTVKQAEGECMYPWTLPEADADKVKVKVEVIDDAFVSKSDASDNIFIIDSTAPYVTDFIPHETEDVSIKKDIIIRFNEKMNQSATWSAFTISPDIACTNVWNEEGNTLTVKHADFEFNRTYTVNLTTAAKDVAGNYLDKNYNWSFNTSTSMSVTIFSPSEGDIWTGGGIIHSVEYDITGSVGTYDVVVECSIGGGEYQELNITTQVEEGLHNFSWSLPSVDSTNVNLRINVTDINGVFSSDIVKFEIDSTAPWIVTYTGNDTYITTTESIMVVFSEEMNKASAESAFSLKDADDVDVNGTFSWNENVMSFVPDENLTSNMNYSATINTNATDKSNPGNHLVLDVFWSFIAVEGRGDLIVGSPIIFPSPEKGKTSTITVTVSNTGPEAENLSGFLTVKFYASRDAGFSEDDLIYTGYISNIEENNSDSASTLFTFDDYGEYYFLVEVTSTNPADTFPGGEKTGRASASVNIPKPSEEIGLGPYTLIALMVVIVVIVAAMILLSLKKKGELTLKEKEGGKEEAEKESEEEK